MSQIEKLIQSILNNPKDVRFDDACKVAEMLGFTGKGGNGTSHHAFSRPGDATGLNFQRGKDGKIPAYQGRQLCMAIEKYWSGPK